MPDSNNRKILQSIREMQKATASLASQFDNLPDDLSTRKRDNIDKKLVVLADDLQRMRYKLDPGKHGMISISLGRPDAIARFFAFSFVNCKRLALKGIENDRFHGAGVYAIYYKGSEIPTYLPISGAETPIYVGKAVSTDPTAECSQAQGIGLWRRLREHLKSIERGGLLADDFEYRYAIIQTGMEGAVEDFMIRLFHPIWNKECRVCYGIGKHGDSARTRENKRSPWDTMHPGRPWADATRENQSSREEIVHRIENHFKEHHPFQNREILIEHLSLTWVPPAHLQTES